MTRRTETQTAAPQPGDRAERAGDGWAVTLDDGRKAHVAGPDAASAIATARAYFERQDNPPLTPARRKAIRLAEIRDEDVCGRCGGAGGASCWPGWTCYDCGGRGTVARDPADA